MDKEMKKQLLLELINDEKKIEEFVYENYDELKKMYQDYGYEYYPDVIVCYIKLDLLKKLNLQLS
jgi:hypothetical protein